MRRSEAPLCERHPADDGTVRYLLETDVPVYTFPLVPDPTELPELDLLVLRRVRPDGQPHDLLPLGQLLAALQQQSLFDQELAAEGTTIRRRHLIRGYDGKPLLWTGRERTTGGHYGPVPSHSTKSPHPRRLREAPSGNPLIFPRRCRQVPEWLLRTSIATRLIGKVQNNERSLTSVFKRDQVDRWEASRSSGEAGA